MRRMLREEDLQWVVCTPSAQVSISTRQMLAAAARRLHAAAARHALLPHAPHVVAAPRLMAAPRSMLRGLCTDSSSGLTAVAWLELAKAGAAPPIRFPLGTPVKCNTGDAWITGTVVAHGYREESWPAERPSAPYQVLLDDQFVVDENNNAIWAPADADELIRSNFRFPLGAAAECRVGKDDWVRCTVVGHMYREEKWPDGRFVPYQVRVGDVLPGSEPPELKALAGQLIWLPKDNAENIRKSSDLRWERLQTLVQQRDSGKLDAEAFAEQRRALIHEDL